MITRDEIELGAKMLRKTLPVFTRGNLFHAVRRLEKRDSVSREAFDAALTRRLARGSIAGLIVSGALARTRLSRLERRAYFPAGILLVDRPEIVDLFATSGALVQARIAIVDVNEKPADVVRWLTTAARAGRRAPVAYLHDARTVLYPFAFEPLATLTRSQTPIRFRDLGIRPNRGLRDPHTRRVVFELEEATPATLISYAVRALLGMIEADAMLAPEKPSSRRMS